MNHLRDLQQGTHAGAGKDAHTNMNASAAAPLSELSGIIVRTTEIAAVRLNPRKGVEGNEVLFRSGVTVTLSYEIARGLAEKLRDDPESCRCSAASKDGAAYGASGGEALVYVAGK